MPLRRAARLWPLAAALACSLLRGAPADGAGEIESAAERAALPEFQLIPAAAGGELTPGTAVDPAQFRGWTRSQGDAGSRRFSQLDQIDRSNVGRLKVAWEYHSRDGADNLQCTPIIVGNRLYAPTAGRALVALDAATGAEVWRYQFEAVAKVGLQDAPARRGLVYWPGDGDNPPRLLVGCGNWIYAFDPATGKLLAGFGENGRASIPTGATVGGAVSKFVFITSGLYGDAYGYDVRNGALLWRFHSLPHAGEVGAETWSTPQAGADGWSGVTVDEGRGMAFIAFGNPRPDMVGVERLGDDLFSDCLVALDAATGRRLWHFQDVRHDIWDLDVCAPPNLATITRDGKPVDVVTAVAKSGMLLLLDRVSGKPIFPFRLRRVPTSDLPGERTAPYQPDPELPERISTPEFKASEITDITPAAHDFVAAQVQKSRFGFFVPPSLHAPTLYIGSRGGGEWSGAAVDMRNGRLYVTSNRWVSMINLIRNDDRERDGRYPPSAGETHYVQYCAACHGPTRQGNGMVPPLVGLKDRLNDEQVLALLKTGRAGMPPNNVLTAPEKSELLDFLFRRNQPPGRIMSETGDSLKAKYTFGGYRFLVDNEGYPGIKPPWGLLNCYDLSTGKILWRSRLGELEELTKAGIPKTGSQNLGGASVTAGGLVFVAGTADQKLRAFDAETGAEIWSARLPFAGTSAPAIYEVAGREYVVITATGGGRVGGPKGDAYVAFSLPPPSAAHPLVPPSAPL